MFYLLCVILYACSYTHILATSVTYYSLEDTNTYFENFMAIYQRQYIDEREKRTRAKIFKNNLKVINNLNQRSENAVYGITKFIDLPIEEISDKVRCLVGNITMNKDYCQTLYDTDIIETGAPESFDWRTRNVVTGVKDQGNCRSCYAFSACGQLEAQNALKNKRLVDLSPQQIVDCDNHSQGCLGGYMSSAYSTLLKLGGAMRNAEYPYLHKSRKCRSDESKVAVKLTGCYTYNLSSQDMLKQLLYRSGPIAVGISFTDGMAFYDRGIIMDSQCNSGKVNHAVLLVGYGTEKGIPYWTCKNSLGSNWGEAGYFRLQRGEGAYSCGILNPYMATATIKKSSHRKNKYKYIYTTVVVTPKYSLR